MDMVSRDAAAIVKSIAVGKLKAQLDGCDSAQELTLWIKQLKVILTERKVPENTVFDLTGKALSLKQLFDLRTVFLMRYTPTNLIIIYQMPDGVVFELKRDNIENERYYHEYFQMHAVTQDFLPHEPNGPPPMVVFSSPTLPLVTNPLRQDQAGAVQLMSVVEGAEAAEKEEAVVSGVKTYN
jgi:hypothetical protein